MSNKSNLSSLVREIILEKNLTPHAFVRLLSFGLGCLKELDLDITGQVASVDLSVDAYGRAKLPCDFVDWVRIGSNSGHYHLNMGQTSTFYRKLKKDANGAYIPMVNDPDALAWYTTQYYWGGWYSGLNSNGGTKLDEFMILDGVAQFGPAYGTGDVVTMDYIYFDKANATTEIHKYAESTIKAWMEWKYILHLPKANPQDKREAKEYYFQQIALLQARRNNLTYEGIMRLRARYQKQL